MAENKQGKSYKPPFKAIETRYDGYHFRSRQEARWATFFNDLDIPYQYEPEGYVMDGTPYLPDFYLPKQDCFIEVKGVEPTYEERYKAKQLALYTQKMVYILYGRIGPLDASSNDKLNCFGWRPPEILINDDHWSGPTHVLIALEKLYHGGIAVKFNEEKQSLELERKWWTWSEKADSDLAVYHGWQEDLKDMHDRFQDGLRGVALLEEHLEDIKQALNPGEDSIATFYSQYPSAEFGWSECPRCGYIQLAYFGWINAIRCGCLKSYDNRTPNMLSDRLVNAYKCAREARF